MKSIQKIIIRILFLVFLLVGFNFIYSKFFFEVDLQEHSPVINIVRDAVKSKAEVIYLGESSNITYRSDDFDKRIISEFISDYYPKIKFSSITKAAVHAGIYYELLRNIPKDSDVKTIIVTMNLRSFGASWIYSDLETALQKEIVLLKDNPSLYKRFLLSFKAYDIKSAKEREKQFKSSWKKSKLKFPWKFQFDNVSDWDAFRFHNGIKFSNGEIDQKKTELACNYIKTYAFQIDVNSNPRIQDFDKIVELAKERNWNLVFNLLAENIETADSLVGKELIYLMRKNRDLLIKRYHKKGVLVVDNLEKVRNSEFVDQNWTTEHYAETGRKIIAQNVAKSLQRFYPNEFQIVSLEKKLISSFFNNCEGKIPWGQDVTISNEKHFSGKSSSKTGNGEDFSVTFEYGVKNLVDSLKYVEVEFQVYQSTISPETKIMFELTGQNVPYTIDFEPLSSLTNGVNKWRKVSTKFKIPDIFYKADVIKIYLYNPTKKIVFIDDLKIEFK